MKTIGKILLLSLLALAVTSCSPGYHMYQGGPGSYRYARVHESTYYPAVYVAAPSRVAVPYRSYSRWYMGGGTFGGAMGGGMGGGM